MHEINLGSEYFTINQFAKFTGITAESLRHYDNEGIFKPAAYGEGAKEKHRLYSPLQITTVKFVRVMTQIGVPLKEIKELAVDRTLEKMIKVLSKYRGNIEGGIRSLSEAHSVVDTLMELMYEAVGAAETELIISEMPEKRIVLGEVTELMDETDFMKDFQQFCHPELNPLVNTSFPIGGYFEDMEAFVKAPSKPTRFFTIDPKGKDVKTAGLHLVGYTRGYYGKTNGLQERMAAFAKENRLFFNGGVYNIYLSDEVSEVDPERYLLQASVPVIKKW